MRQWFLKQRTKPKHVRDNIAFGFASGAALLVLVGWLTLIPKNDIFRDNVTTEKSPEAFSTFFDQIKEQVAGVRGSVTKQTSSPESNASSTEVVPVPSNSTLGSGFSTTSAAVIYVIPSASTTGSTSKPTVTY